MRGRGGFFLAGTLDGTEKVSSSYWSELLKVVGVSALPLVAVAVRLPRSAAPQGWRRWTGLLVLAALPLTLLIIGVCLNGAARTPKDGGDAPYAAIYISAMGCGVILAAVAVGVAADVLDQIDAEPPQATEV